MRLHVLEGRRRALDGARRAEAEGGLGVEQRAYEGDGIGREVLLLLGPPDGVGVRVVCSGEAFGVRVRVWVRARVKGEGEEAEAEAEAVAIAEATSMGACELGLGVSDVRIRNPVQRGTFCRL